MVQYEDLVDRTMETMKEVYAFMGVPFTEVVRKIIWEHSNSQPVSTTDLGREPYYFGVHVDSSFKHDRWKQNLSTEVILATREL